MGIRKFAKKAFFIRSAIHDARHFSRRETQCASWVHWSYWGYWGC